MIADQSIRELDIYIAEIYYFRQRMRFCCPMMLNGLFVVEYHETTRRFQNYIFQFSIYH